MKLKIKKDKKMCETRIDYFKVDGKSDFRFTLIKMILNIDSDISLIIDTNQSTQYIPPDDIESILNKANIAFTVFPIKRNSTLFLGVRANVVKKKMSETDKLYILSISFESFSRELFDSLFQYFDLAFGITRKKPLDESRDALKTLSTENVLFNKNYFEHSIYDSIVCTTLRSSIDIQNYVWEQKT